VFPRSLAENDSKEPNGAPAVIRPCDAKEVGIVDRRVRARGHQCRNRTSSRLRPRLLAADFQKEMS